MINRLRRGFDPGFFIVLLICLLAVWPLISRASLPEGTDAELHIFRLHELSLLIRGGELYPRWAPNFYHGFGYPIFNYYAPLAYYLALPFELLPSIDATLASKIVLVMGMLLGGLGIYGFVRDNWGRRAGYVAAALYVYSPYIQYIDPHIRGALPEALSFGLFPLALWAIDRLRRRPTTVSWLASVVMIAAVILSHNLMGLFFFALLFAWVAWQAGLVWWADRHSIPDESQANRHGNWAAVARPAAALLLGLGLSAFFWFPVFMERNAVTLNTLIGAGGHYDFRTHFLSLGELLALSQMPDWGATQSPNLFNLGVAQWGFGLLGLVLLLMRRGRQRSQLSFFALVLIAILCLMLPVSEPIWELIPFLPFFQFPWRLLGAAAALLAILGSSAIPALLEYRGISGHGTDGDVVTSTGYAVWFYAAAIGLTIVLAFPLSQPAPWKPFGEVNTLRMSLIENSGRWLGTTSTADYVPATVTMLPARRSSVVDPLGLGLPPDRINREALPDGAEVTTEVVRPLLTRYHVSAPKNFRLRLYQFDFSGWRVTVDGEPAVTELAEPEGFIVILIPEGKHIVEVKFGTTPPRTAGWLITLVSLVLTCAVAWRLSRRPATPKPVVNDGYAPRFARAEWPIIAVTGGLTLFAILFEPLGLLHYESQGQNLDIPANSHYSNLGDQIALLGYNASTDVLEPGDTLDLTLYWQALRSLDIDYQVFVHILDSEGRPVAQSDKLNPGEFPTHRWPLGKYVPDSHQLTLPADLPPGDYTVATGMWVRSEGWRLPIFDPSGRSVGDKSDLFTLKVE